MLMPEPKPNLNIIYRQKRKKNKEQVSDKILKNKYAGEIIGLVWKRLSIEGITNADNLIGTRDTIENVDFEKFWQNVKEIDIQRLIEHYLKSKESQLSDFEKFSDGFNPATVSFTSNDTSFFDQKISDLLLIKNSIKHK